MAEMVVKLRYNPGDNLQEIKPADLDKVARKFGVKVAVEERIGRNRVTVGNVVFEEPWDVPFEQVSQFVITVSAQDGEALRQSLRELIKLYRSPVPIWGMMGSSPEGEAIAWQVIEEDDGW